MAEYVISNNVVGEEFTDEDCINIEWLKTHTKLDVASATMQPLVDAGGLSAEMQMISLVLTNGESRQLVLKRNRGTERSIQIGLSREAFFYHYFAPKISDIVPKIVYTFGNMESGKKAIIMENLSGCIQCGYFFGKHSPHNHRKDLKSIIGYEDESPERVQAMEIVTESAFRAAAELHSAYWGDRNLLDYSWVRGHAWLRGEGREAWLVAQKQASDPWEITKAKISSGATSVQWNPLVIDILNASMSKISWDNYQASVQDPNYIFSLVHGDFHPANMMWRRNSNFTHGEVESGSTILLDWEVVGVGNGPQDCAQYVISHMRPSERRACEQRLLRTYYDALIAGGVDSTSYSFERCQSDYIQGGIGRWVWLLALITTIVPDNWVQYFHDQVLAFAEDHGVTALTVPMPRV